MIFRLSKNTANFIKVIAAIMVMMHHYSQYVCANHISESIVYKALSSQAGFLGVAVFFFLSGFGLMESEQKSHLGFVNFFKRRFLKVYLPVLTVTLIWLIISKFTLPQSPFDGIEVGGGKLLVISNILINFGDDVLWFIKTLIGLYAIFYIYCYVRQHNQLASMIFLIVAAVGSTISTAIVMKDYLAISIPFFFLGIVLSLDKEKKGVLISLSLIALIVVLEILTLKDTSLAMHNTIDAIAIALLIITCAIRDIEIRIPSFIAALSLDIYLVHNKVLMSLKANSDVVELVPFLLLTIIATLGFYFFRTKLLRI